MYVNTILMVLNCIHVERVIRKYDEYIKKCIIICVLVVYPFIEKTLKNKKLLQNFE
jgi:hypothetical protein